MRNHRIIIYLSLLLLIIVVSCTSSDGENGNDFEEIERVNISTASPSVAISPFVETPTKEISIMTTPFSIGEGFPRLAINVGPNMSWSESYSECDRDHSEIWLFDYPFDSGELLVKHEGADVKFPEWSPNGEWIAFIESKPTIPLNSLVQNIEGNDSIWITRPDGSEVIKIGSDLPGEYWRDQNLCFQPSSVPVPPVWSPGNNKLVFVKVDMLTFMVSYYLADIEKNTVTQFLELPKGTRSLFGPHAGTWISESQLVIVGTSNEIYNIRFSPSGNIETGVISPPDLEFDQPVVFASIRSNLRYAPQLNDMYLYGLMVGKNQYQDLALWRVDLTTGMWEYLHDANHRLHNVVFLVNDYFIACTDSGDLNLIGSSEFATEAEYITGFNSGVCDHMQVFGGQSFISFMNTYPVDGLADRQSMWVVRLQPEYFIPEIIFDISSLSADVSSYLTHILDYSWEP